MVEAETIGVFHDETLGLTLLIVEGGDASTTQTETIALTLSITNVFEIAENNEYLELNLNIGTGENEGLVTWVPTQTIGLTLDLAIGKPYNLILVWEPWDKPSFTGKNYTYIVHLALQGVDIEADITVRFEGSKLTEKTTNATGFMEYWAIVGSPGIHTWSFTVYDDGQETALIYHEVEYVNPGGVDDDGGDPPPGPGPVIIDLPTEPGALFGVLDYLPAMVVFGFFGFGGMLFMGRLGILFGVVGALFVTTAMGTLPTWLLYFAILIAILVVVFKLKSGGSKVTVEGGNA